ncbi:MAG: hypothetical protein IPG81_27025 [Sandaracinaceae bacterium]|nr:hypothetical protein [Sandaracinaceae bacterium]
MPRAHHHPALGAVLAALVVVSSAALAGCGQPSPAAPFVPPADCVFQPVEDSAEVTRVVVAWAERARLGTLTRWGLEVGSAEAVLTVEASAWAGVVRRTPPPSCDGAPTVSSASTRGDELSAQALAPLARHLPLPRRALVEAPPDEPARRAPFVYLSLAILVVGGLGERRTRVWRRAALAVVLLGVLALALLALWPLFTLPFDCDTPVLRAAYAREHIFDDWNHPFLPYLLNHLPTRLSLEPWAVRVVPFGFVLMHLAAVVLLAARWGGTTAGALAGVWLAAELPRRPSIDQLVDWDLAGVFLLALAAWLTWRERQGALGAGPVARRSTAWLVALTLGGFFSSYMMIVPLGVLVVVLLVSPHTARLEKQVAAVGFALLALRAVLVFVAGDGLSPVVDDVHVLLAEMANELPSARQPLMLLPMAMGVAWLLRGSLRRPPPSSAGTDASRFLLGMLPAVPVATLVAWQWSHVNHGYYICLITPPWLVAAAVGVTRACAWLAERASPWVEPRVGARTGRVLRAAGVLTAIAGLWWLTVSLPYLRGDIHLGPTGIESAAAFDEAFVRDPLPIVTDSFHLPMYVAYERARRGSPVRGAILGPGPDDVVRATHWLDARCAPTTNPVRDRHEPWSWDQLGERFYFVTEAGRSDGTRCPPDPETRCTRLAPERRWLNYFVCETAPPPL